MDMEDFSEGFLAGLREVLGEKDQGLLKDYFNEMLRQAHEPNINSSQCYQQPTGQLATKALGDRPGSNRECNDMLPTTQAKALACPTCNLGFVSQKGLSQHRAKIHDKPVKKAHCHECGKVFTHKHALKFHITQVHEQSTRVKCIVCEKVIYNKYAYKRHLAQVHPESSIKTL